ncbi:hypothetical protein [Streptomyces sp. NPDC059080]|uniref:hypothetical protein n=1 Tax=Streptomyces sp. NPDC059080 TaxID=3346718 RepID=UPI0036CE4DA7
MTIPLLLIPTVRDGDQGLVLEVNGVSPEPQGRRWYVLTLEGRTLGLPAALRPWARELDAQVRRGEMQMPAVFAFRRFGNSVAVEIRSRA